MRDNKLDLLFFSVETNDMVKAINDSPAIRADLKRWGKDARVVTAGFVMVAAATSKTFASSTHVEAQLTAYGVTIDPKLGVSQGGSTAVEFPIGALFAYDISKIEWDNKNDAIVCDLKRDDHGL